MSAATTVRSQLATLFERNLAVTFGAPGTLAVLMLQPPVIGLLIGVAWRDTEPTRTTYFVLVLAATYLGCMNATTAIVRERAVLQRERMVGVRLVPYVLAKLQLLTIVSLVQALLLVLGAAQGLLLPDGFWRRLGIVLVLSLTGICASGLGLLISSWARRPTTAVIVVPLLILPQIIFSEVVLGDRFETGTLAAIGRVTITRWSYDAMVAVTLDDGHLSLVSAPIALALLLTGFLGVTLLKLRLDTP